MSDMRIGNLKIQTKLLLGFGLVIVLTLVLTIVSFLSISSVDRDYSYVIGKPTTRSQYVADMAREFVGMRRAMAAIIVATGDDQDIRDLRMLLMFLGLLSTTTLFFT